MEKLDYLVDEALEKQELKSIDRKYADKTAREVLSRHSTTYEAWKEKGFDDRASEAKDLVKAIRRSLRDAYGLFFKQPYSDEEKQSLLEQSSIDLEAVLERHVSTAERLPHYPYLFDHVNNVFGDIEHVLDLGCGYNPLALAQHDMCKQISMVDISGEELSFLSDILDRQGIANTSYIIDLSNPEELSTINDINDIDVALCFKLFDNLETKTKSISETITDLLIRKTKKGIIVSFPKRTISGRNKIESNREWFDDILDNISNKEVTIVESLNEIFYLIKWKK